ncbi:MAG: cell division protein FtsZ [Paludibacteraceae bacterium]|nr:cell division protein FtsZ [Paludibacteraceae bacterium]
MYDVISNLDLDIAQDTIIKVMGIGGGGCNAVNYMYSQGIKDVSFLVCNTDKMSLAGSSVAAKLQLGPGLGAGGRPEVAQEYAEQSRDRIREALNDGTKMLFLTAGMGGGTGTGASAVVAEVAKEMDILTVGIVTIPFAFEGAKKIKKAMIGVARLAEHVDAILVINNEKLRQIYPDFNFLNAFSKSDDVVANAARSIAEIITVPGYINTDFADVYNTLKNGNVAIMSVGTASGEDRIEQSIHEALHSPLVNSDVEGAKRILLQLYCSTEHPIIMQELDHIHDFVHKVGDEVEVQWGVSIDDTLGEKVRVTLVATGYDVSDIPGLDDAVGKRTVEEAIEIHYGENMTDTPKEVPTAAAVPETLVPQDGDIVIDLNEDDDPLSPTIEFTFDTPTPAPTPSTIPQKENETAKKTGISGLAGWMRRR